jgi:hypothetical protein
MRLPSFSVLALAVVLVAGYMPIVAQTPSDELSLEQMNRLTDAEQLALAKSIVDRGVPHGRPADRLYSLAQGRSALIVPMLEAKIEEILRAPDPRACFTDKSTEPDVMVTYLQAAIWQNGSLQSLVQASKLMKIDEKRFGGMVALTMIAAYSHRNAFELVYQGFKIGDPAIDKRLVEWAEGMFEKDLPNLGDPIFDDELGNPRRLWAEALVDRYGAAPSQMQWLQDPIASRLKPELSILEYHVRRLAAAVAEERKIKQ